MHNLHKIFGANLPAGANLGSFINVGSESPIHFIEYGGLETITSNGFFFIM